MLRNLLLCLSSLALLAACGGEPETAEPVESSAPPAPAAAAPAALDAAAVDAAVASMDSARFGADVQALASDEFGGRAPFTEGERLTVEYLEQAFAAAGVAPGNGESYRQPVALVELTAADGVVMNFDGGDRDPATLAQGDTLVAWTKQVRESVELADSELVFVGYGIVAPEYGWDDYAGLDMAGRTAVILVNDPGFATGDENRFNGRAMTYYGRWTYKFEEAARQGAAGAIIVHQTDAAGYPWEVVTGSWLGAQFDIATEDDGMDRVKVEAWISEAAAQELLARAGQDFSALATAAAEPGFEPVPLGVTVSARIDNTIRRSESSNVLGLIPGSERPEEVVIYMAHWDHLGTAASGDGDLIYNGAVDNATGTAALLEIARAFQALPRAPKRSVLFLAVTAEESGLLGSAYYADNPVYPTNMTVGGVNIDAMNVTGRTRDIVVVGWDASTLQDVLAVEAAAQDRVLVPEPTPEKGYFYRSDHFSFAKKGVPVLYAEGGQDVRGKGIEFGAAAAADYVANRYHKPADEYDPSWDLAGMMEDMALYFRIGVSLAEDEQWPSWRPGNEFEAARKADLAGNQ